MTEHRNRLLWHTYAQWDSDCPACGAEIWEGDLIAKIGGDWLCADCATGDTHDVA